MVVIESRVAFGNLGSKRGLLPCLSVSCNLEFFDSWLSSARVDRIAPRMAVIEYHAEFGNPGSKRDCDPRWWQRAGVSGSDRLTHATTSTLSSFRHHVVASFNIGFLVPLSTF